MDNTFQKFQDIVTNPFFGGEMGTCIIWLFSTDISLWNFNLKNVYSLILCVMYFHCAEVRLTFGALTER
jgi:hypothetical protein